MKNGIPENEAAYWAPFGKYGFRYMFWVRFNTDTGRLVYRWAQPEEELRREYELERFNYIKEPCTMDLSLRLFHRENHHRWSYLYKVINPDHSSPRRAVLVMDPYNRVVVVHKPTPRCYHTYDILCSLCHGQTWYYYVITMKESKIINMNGAVVMANDDKVPFKDFFVVPDYRLLDMPDLWGLRPRWERYHSTLSYIIMEEIILDVFKTDDDESSFDLGWIPLHQLMGNTSKKRELWF